MKSLDVKLLQKFLTLAGNTLQGRWLLVGGTLLPALGINIRSTVDIDLIGLGEKEIGQTLQLMDIADRLGLSVESINQAAAFFLKKIKYDKKDLLILHEGHKATIYRPSLELYWRLKIKRLSESDVLDCQSYYEYCVKNKDPIYHKKLVSILKTTSPSHLSHEQRTRINILVNLLTTSPSSQR